MTPPIPRPRRGPASLRALQIACIVALAMGPWASGASAQAERAVHAATRGGAPAGTEPSEGPATDKARDKEYKVKAALLYKFLQYTTFPKGTFPNDKAPIEILVVGEDPFGPILEDVLGGKKVDGRTIRIRRVADVPETLDATLVFAGKLDAKERALLVERSLDRPCVLVGEEPGFAEAGAFINFYKKDRKLAFEVNVTRQKDTAVTLKAELLKLARIVEKAPPRPKEKGPRDADGEGGR